MDIEKNDPMRLRVYMEAYAVAVRAGLVTPCLDDEELIRKKFGLGPAPQVVKDDWSSTDGVRRPNTLKAAPSEVEATTAAAEAGKDPAE